MEGTAGPVRGWLEDFRRRQQSAVDIMLLTALLAFVFLGLSMHIVWFHFEGPDWYYGVSGPEFFMLMLGVPLLWYGAALALRSQALRRLRPWLARGLEEHNLLGSELGTELLAGGDGGSFRRSLLRLSRSLPGFVKRKGLHSGGPWERLGLLSLLAVVLLGGWIMLLHLNFGRWFEYPLLCMLLLGMLLQYRLRLDGAVQRLALADYLLSGLGSSGDVDSARPVPAPPPPRPPAPRLPD
ncbi:MAG: hypothetical protein R3F46_05510 [bacterium]